MGEEAAAVEAAAVVRAFELLRQELHRRLEARSTQHHATDRDDADVALAEVAAAAQTVADSLRRSTEDRYALDLTVPCPATDCQALQGEPCRGCAPPIVHLGRRIRRLARARGWTDEELADRVAAVAAGEAPTPTRKI